MLKLGRYQPQKIQSSHLKAGVENVKDHLDEASRFISFDDFVRKFKVKTSYLEYYKVVSTRTRYKKNYVRPSTGTTKPKMRLKLPYPTQNSVKKKANFETDKPREWLRKCQKPCKRETYARRVSLSLSGWRSFNVDLFLFFSLFFFGWSKSNERSNESSKDCSDRMLFLLLWYLHASSILCWKLTPLVRSLCVPCAFPLLIGIWVESMTSPIVIT